MVIQPAVAHHHVAELAAGRLVPGHSLAFLDLGQLVAQIDGAFRQHFQSLTDDLDALVALQGADHHTGKYVAAVHHGHVKVKVLIGGVGRVLAHVDLHAGGSGMGAYSAHADGVLSGQHAHALGAHGDGLVGEGDLGDPVQRGLQLVAGCQNLPAKLVADVPSCAADGHHGVVDTVSGHLLQQVHDQLTLVPDVHKHAVVADDVAGDAQPQEMRVQTLQLCGDHADILASLGHIHAVDGLHGHGISKRVGVGADTADPLHQHQGLDGVSLGGQLFNAAMVISDEYLGLLDHLALGIELGVYRLLQGGMVGSDGNDIAHLMPPPSLHFSQQALSGA